jgi:hypothetical protein
MTRLRVIRTVGAGCFIAGVRFVLPSLGQWTDLRFVLFLPLVVMAYEVLGQSWHLMVLLWTSVGVCASKRTNLGILTPVRVKSALAMLSEFRQCGVGRRGSEPQCWSSPLPERLS